MSGCSHHGREVTWHPQPKVTAGKSPDSHNQKRAWIHVAAQLQAPFIQARTQAQGMRPSTVVGLSIPANITKIIIPLRNSEALLPGDSRLCRVNKSNHHHNCASLRLPSAHCISWQGTEGWTGHLDALHYKDRHACNSMLWGGSCSLLLAPRHLCFVCSELTPSQARSPGESQGLATVDTNMAHHFKYLSPNSDRKGEQEGW